MADQELVITLRWAAEAAEQMANQYFQRRRRNIQDVAEAEQAANDQAAKNLRSRVRDATETETRSQKEITQQHQNNLRIRVKDAIAAENLTQKQVGQIRNEAAQAGHRMARQETDNRISELNRLQAAIRSRYRNAVALERESIAMGQAMAAADTNNRIRELDRLQAAIRARFAGRGQFGMMMESAQGGFQGAIAARLKARRQIQQEELAGQQKFDKEWVAMEQDATRAVAAITDKFHQDRADKARAAAKERAFVEDREAQSRIDRERQAAQAFERYAGDREKAEAASLRKIDALREADAQAVRGFLEQERRETIRDDAQARIESSTNLADEQVRIAKGATEEMRRAQNAYQAFRKAGDKEGMESSRQYFQRRSQDAKQAIESASRYTKQAEREMGEALKHRTDEDRVALRRANQQRIDGVRAATKATVQGYDEVARSGTRAMNEVTAANRTAAAAAQEHGHEVYTVGQMYFALHAFSEFGSVLERVWTAVGASTKETDDYVKDIVEHMRQLRGTMGEILAMRGMPITAGSVSRVARQAMEANVTTQDYVAFETKLTEDIANVTEPAKLAAITERDIAGMSPEMQASVRAAKAKYPIGAEQRERLGKATLPYVKSLGMTPEAGASIFATTLASTRRGKDGRVNDQEFLAEFARNAETLQFQRGKASETAAQFDRVIQQFAKGGMSPEKIQEFRKQFSATAQAKPEQAGLLLENFFRGMDEVINDEKKREELGLGEDVGYAEVFPAIMKYIDKEKTRTPKVPTEAIVRRMIGYKVAARGFAAQYDIGVKGGGYRRQEAFERGITADTVKARGAEYAKLPVAKAAVASAEEDYAKAIRAETGLEDYETFEKRARNEVIANGELEEYQTLWDAILDQAGKGKTFETREELQTYQMGGKLLMDGLLAYEDDDEVARILDETEDGKLLMTSAGRPMQDHALRRRAFAAWQRAVERRARRGGKPRVGAGAILRRARKEAERRVDSMSSKVGGEDIQGSRDYLVTRQTTEILKGQLGANPPARGRMSDDDYIQHLAAAIADPNLRAMMEAGNSPEARARAERVQAGMHGIPPAEKSSRVANVVMAPGTPPTIFETEKEAMMAHLRNPKDFPIGGGAGAADQAMSLEGPFAGAGIHRMLAAAVRPDAIRNARRHGMEKADPRKAGTWYTDERGHLRHTRRMSAVPLEDAGSMPVTWNVKPNAPSVHRSAAEAATSGDGGIHAAAKELHAAARQMKRHVPSALPARPHVHR